MKMKNKIMGCLVPLLLGACSASEPRIGYINNEMVYNGFLLTTELNNRYETVMESRKRELDSLEAGMSRMQRAAVEKNAEQIDMQQMQLLQQQILYKRQEMEANGQVLQQKYNEQIFSRMHDYLQEYGKEKNYRYLLGANGDGNIMYANEADDCTKDVITYINEKYRGIK